MKLKFHSFAIAAALVAALYTVGQSAEPAAPHAAEEAAATPAEALARLKTGNEHFVSNKVEHPHQTVQWRTTLATGQHPFAIVLGCADSRTSPEVLFDQGLGDLFVVRVAGNVLSDELLGSIEYAVEHLGAPLIVVLGHERCGAVKAARETIAAHAEAPGHIQSLVKAIRPAVDATSNADAETTCKANVINVVHALQESGPFLKERVEAGKVKVVGAHYDLDTGAVEFLKEPEAKK
ncbi:MAG: carbonic anhydrase [Verrucomicrobium sp.]|nr:carbonic anhydrase [Verrucomicrobium sp.]